MTLSEETMSYLEEHIPELANVAFKQAYWATLASGSSVLVSEDGKLVEMFPDGRHKFIKQRNSSLRACFKIFLRTGNCIENQYR